MITQELNTAIELIRHPERMDRNTISLIQDAMEQYPYYQTLHLLLLKNMYKVHDLRFSEQLKALSVMVADRAVLFDMVEGENFTIPVTKLDDEAAECKDGDKTLFLIDNFLKGIADQPYQATPSDEKPSPRGDYSLYLEQLPDFDEPLQESQPEPEAAPEPPTISVEVSTVASQPLDDNLESATADTTVDNEEFTIKSIRQQLAQNTDHENPPADDDSGSKLENNEYFTETMAGLYIKQQKYEQALEIIRGISAENPKKSVYFADQMRYLELLIRINKNKTK